MHFKIQSVHTLIHSVAVKVFMTKQDAFCLRVQGHYIFVSFGRSVRETFRQSHSELRTSKATDAPTYLYF